MFDFVVIKKVVNSSYNANQDTLGYMRSCEIFCFDYVAIKKLRHTSTLYNANEDTIERVGGYQLEWRDLVKCFVWFCWH